MQQIQKDIADRILTNLNDNGFRILDALKPIDNIEQLPENEFGYPLLEEVLLSNDNSYPIKAKKVLLSPPKDGFDYRIQLIDENIKNGANMIGFYSPNGKTELDPKYRKILNRKLRRVHEGKITLNEKSYEDLIRLTSFLALTTENPIYETYLNFFMNQKRGEGGKIK